MNMSIHDNAGLTLEYSKDCLVRVCKCTDMETGESWREVYRSLRLGEDRPMFQPARDLIGDAALLRREVVDDDMMAGARAELSRYTLRTEEHHA